ncbi:MAG TPA: efflux RND transporter periplasmic adaptor subunit [Chthoniobacterales bacterium]
MTPLSRTARLAGLWLAALLLAGCPKRDAHELAPPPVPVETARVEARTIPVQRDLIGAVEPMASVQLKSKVQGEIIGVHFADGANVTEGEKLFSIDPRSYAATLTRAQADVAAAQAGYDNAKEQADRYTTLIKRGVASKEQFTQYRTAAVSQAAALAARQADLEEARLSKDWTSVTAPISGRAGAALIKRGNIVQANSEVLVVIHQTKPIYVTFSLPEADLDDVRERMAEGDLAVLARNPENGAVLGEGTLSFVDNAVDRTSGMFVLKGSFPNDNESLWPGQFVDVTLRLAEERGVLTVPTASILDSQSGSQVFVIRDGLAELRKVETGRTAGADTVIRSGLAAGEVVVSSGQLRLSAGGKVQIKNAPPAAPAEP